MPTQEIIIDGVIAGTEMPGVTSARSIRNQLEAANGSDVIVSINSEGGEVFEGVSIYEQLKRYVGGVSVRVDGLAASIASYIMLAGRDGITIADGGFVMTHGAWAVTMGDADEHDAKADLLRKITDRISDAYAARTGMDRNGAAARFVQGENWFDADEAVAVGLVDSVNRESEAIEARVADPSLYTNLPAALRRTSGNTAPPSALATVSIIQGRQRALARKIRFCLEQQRRKGKCQV